MVIGYCSHYDDKLIQISMLSSFDNLENNVIVTFCWIWHRIIVLVLDCYEIEESINLSVLLILILSADSRVCSFDHLECDLVSVS